MFLRRPALDRTDVVMETRQLGKTDVHLTELGCGGSQLGGMFAPLSDEQAAAALRAASDQGVGYFDTSPFYGRGQSEHRIGRHLRDPDVAGAVVSTKVGRVLFRPPDPEGLDCPDAVDGLPFDFRFDYSYDGILRSYQDSLQRMGRRRVDILFVHDLDGVMHPSADSVEHHLAQLQDGWRALDELRAAGEIRAIGVGVNVLGMIPRFLNDFDVDAFLIAMPYTLLDQEALVEELPLCVDRGVGVVIGAPFCSGILATGAVADATYGYESTPDPVRRKALAIQEVCDRHQVPMRAAALQFPLAHPSVASVIPGVVSPEQVADNIAMLHCPIPAAFWADLKDQGLLLVDAPVPS